MNRTLRIILGGIAVVALVAAAVFAYIWFSGGSGEASQPISAPTLEAQTSSGATTYRIVPEESEVRFLLDEDLRGQRITVVGTTDQIAGDIAVDLADPASTQIGIIRVNARTLETDQEFRNRALRGQILESQQDAYEFIHFTPTELTGLPQTITLGEPITFQIVGDLQIRDIINSVTFDATVTPVSETRLQGSARTVVMHAAYNLIIPSVPSVANVEEEVELEIDFVAAAST